MSSGSVLRSPEAILDDASIYCHMLSCAACSETFDLILANLPVCNKAAGGDYPRVYYTLEFCR